MGMNQWRLMVIQLNYFIFGGEKDEISYEKQNCYNYHNCCDMLTPTTFLLQRTTK